MINHTPLIRKITYIIGFTSIGLGIGGILFIFIFLKVQEQKSIMNCEEWLTEIALPNSFNGKIVKLVNNDSCKISIEIDTFSPNLIEICSCDEANAFADYIDVHDSVIKQKAELELIIKKPNGETRAFPYPCCE